MQKISRSGLNAILELAANDLDHLQQFPSSDIREHLITTISDFLQQKISFEDATQIFATSCNSLSIINRMQDIVEVGDTPLPSFDTEDDRKKSRSWSNVEDNRLLAGILRNGLENWSTIASFVGNNRTRAQCTQRWSRGLNPKISKETWSPDEEAKLIANVRQFGDKAWTKISKLLGTRSDAQCRYHYIQMSKTMPMPTMPMLSLRPRLSVPSIPPNQMMFMTPITIQFPNQVETRRSSMVQLPPSFHNQPSMELGLFRQQSNPSMSRNPQPINQIPPLNMDPSTGQFFQTNSPYQFSNQMNVNQEHPNSSQYVARFPPLQNISLPTTEAVPIDGFLKSFQ